MSLVPVTIITGFLGSGKTTLLKRVLSEAHGEKIAVIENEFGEENIDNEILISEGEEQILQMNNGCICCTIREDLRSTLTMLATRRYERTLDFERVIIETTGLADPGPVAQTFFMDEDIVENYVLDSIVTLVDAKHAEQQLSDRVEARRQVGFADTIFVTKSDLVDADQLSALVTRLKRINVRAPVDVVEFGEVPLAKVLNVGGFNLNAKLEIDPGFLSEGASENHDECDHEHGDCNAGATSGEQTHGHHHHHDDDVRSFVYRADRPFDPFRLETFMAALVQDHGPNMFRYKGVLNMNGTDRKVIFQGVHQVMGSDLGPQWAADEVPSSKVVFIGIDLPQALIEEGLNQALV